VEPIATVTGGKLGEVTDREIHIDMHQGDCLLIDDGSPHCEDACDVTDVLATCEVEKLSAVVTMPLG
jgi:hypothetical protein